MRSSIELGAVFQFDWDERPIRVIAFDDDVVMYDSWWESTNSWAKLTWRFFYYRTRRDFFETRSRYLRTDPYTEEEYNVHRPDLPLAFATHDSLSWYTQQPNSEVDLEQQLANARIHEQKSAASARLTAPAIHLAPFGPKGMSKPTTLITAKNRESFSEAEMLWHAWQLQAPYLRENQIARGIGIHRLGIQRRKPSYYIWAAKSKLETQ